MAAIESSAASAASVGLGASALALLGLTPQVLVMALIGSIIGVGLAEPTSRFRAIISFLAVTLACAELGAFTADLMALKPHLASGLALLYGIFFYPLLNTVVKSLPDLINNLPFLKKS